ncbi:MAG: protein kinase domain-containing protein [Pseudomonadota bacterium]
MTDLSPQDVDARALRLLDDLMDRGEAERAQALRQIATESPLLHARLLGLLQASDHGVTGDSLLLRPPLPAAEWLAAEGGLGALAPGASFAGYRLLREIGRGGMSVVWLAEREDGLVKRAVALKLAQVALAPVMMGERFARERDVLASLSHPHIAQLLDAGVATGGQPFIALEFVDGAPIDAWCDAQRLPIEKRLGLFLQVLSAVAHAHRHLVVHRDLKPSNILVDTQGQVKLLDFGIAKLLGGAAGDTQLTQLGGCALTPRYAAPEQVSGGVISTMTDVYSLGIVLYELLAGSSPYPAADGAMAAMARAVLDEPAPPLGQAALDDAQAQARGLPDGRRLRAALAGDLDTIVRKCLSTEPGQRYHSVDALADDVRRFLAREPIAARRPSWAYRARLFLRRHRAAVASVGVGALVAVALGGVVLQERRVSSQQTARADAVRDFLSDLMSDAEPDESKPGAAVTGKDMIDAAVARLKAQFHDQPRLAGELLGELGRMYARVDEPALSTRTLREAAGLLEGHAPDADPELNKVRANLATRLLAEGQRDEAERLASRAHAACTVTGTECTKARAYASLALSSLALGRGQMEDALVLARRAAREMEQAFPKGDASVVDALERLAVMARNAGQPLEARDALNRALQLGETPPMRLRAVNRLRLLRTQALLEMDLGHLAAARAQFEALLRQPSSDDEQLVQLRLLSSVLAAQGDAAPALDMARRATALVDGEAEPLTAALVGQAQAVAQSLSGDGASARKDMRGAIGAFARAGIAPDGDLMLRARRVLGEVLARAGDLAAAQQELEATAQALRQAIERKPGAVFLELELAHVLDQLGCVLREAGNPLGARPLHEQAAPLFERRLPPNHPFAARNALYQDIATWRLEATPANRERLVQTVSRYLADVPERSVWRTQLDRALADAPCTGAGGGCVLML